MEAITNDIDQYLPGGSNIMCVFRLADDNKDITTSSCLTNPAQKVSFTPEAEVSPALLQSHTVYGNHVW